MTTLKRLFLGLAFALFIAAPVMAFSQPAPTSFAAPECEKRLFGIPPWYRGLTGDAPQCNVKSPTDASIAGATESAKLQNFIILIALNVIEMATVIVGYIAVFFILYGGFTFIVNGSGASGVEKARKTILHAVIGLAIALGAVAILNLIYGVVV
jgi:hypothetical protein